MSEQVRDSRVNRIRSRLYASFGGRVAAYGGVVAGSHLVLGEQGRMNTNTLAGIGLGLGSVAATIIERRFAHRRCAAIVNNTEDYGYNHLAVNDVADGRRTHGVALVFGSWVPLAGILTEKIPGSENLPEADLNNDRLFGLLGVTGVAAGLGLDAIAIHQAVNGYSAQIEAQQPLNQPATI